jgi:hypothetical protein
MGHKQAFVKQVRIYKIKEALYGLKKVSRLWHAHIDSFLHSLGFTRSASDPNLYILEILKPKVCYVLLLLNVDDRLIGCQSRIQVNRLKTLLSEKY